MPTHNREGLEPRVILYVHVRTYKCHVIVRAKTDTAYAYVVNLLKDYTQVSQQLADSASE